MTKTLGGERGRIGLVSALARPEVGLLEAGFEKWGKSGFQRRVSPDVTWRVVVYSDPDQEPWIGRVWAGAHIPSTDRVFPLASRSKRDPGIFHRNLLELAGRERPWTDHNYDGTRPNRLRLLRRMDAEELEAVAARDLGEMMRNSGLPWFRRMTDIRSVAAVMQESLGSLGEGKEPWLWAELGVLWKFAGEDSLAELAWQRGSAGDEKNAAYVARLKRAI